MSKQIHDYTAAGSIDPSGDYFLIDPGSTGNYNKINRNVALGLSSAPVGMSDSQSPTNKTFDNTNTVTLKDTNFTLQDNGDTTKQLQFQLSGITTGTTRTLTVPNANDTLVGLAATQTLTNKTLTSPTITGGTIDNSTITVDTISGHTTSTTVTVGNVQMANGIINTSGAVTSTAIATGAVQPQALVSGTGSGWAWQSWTPTWSNFTVGNATQIAKYTQIGKTVIGRINVALGTTSSMGSSPTFTLPVTASSAYTAGSDGIGICNMIQSTNDVGGIVFFNSTTSAGLYVWNSGGSYLVQAGITSTVPFTWSNGNVLCILFTYEAA